MNTNNMAQLLDDDVVQAGDYIGFEKPSKVFEVVEGSPAGQYIGWRIKELPMKVGHVYREGVVLDNTGNPV